jgi:hypothetical protein
MEKENGTSWLAGAAVAILVAVIGAYATIKASQPRSDPPPKPPERNLAEVYGPQLKSAVDLACGAQIQAVRELNESPLAQIFKGTALKSRSAVIDSLRKGGVFALAQRDGISYGEITVDPDERHARVHFTPTWELVFFSVAYQRCVWRWAPYEVPQTMDLERSDSGWMVDAVVFDNDATPAKQPCR